jgi:integrase
VSIEKFLNDWLAKKRQTNAEGTALRYERTVRSFVQHLGTKAKRSLAVLVPSDIERYLETEVADGKNATTCNTAIKTLRSALNVARRQGLVPSNPAEAIELLPSDGEDRLCFTPDQIKSILQVADQEWRGLTLLGNYVGARLDVVARLRWTNVDLKRNLICYETNKVRRGKKPTIIQCPIHPELREHLESLHLAKNGEDHLLPVLAKRRKSGRIPRDPKSADRSRQ